MVLDKSLKEFTLDDEDYYAKYYDGKVIGCFDDMKEIYIDCEDCDYYKNNSCPCHKDDQ